MKLRYSDSYWAIVIIAAAVLLFLGAMFLIGHVYGPYG